MPKETLDDVVQKHGNPARMLRNAPIGLYPFPYPPQYSNWRDEQRAWSTTSLMFDQSKHMHELHFQGPDLERFLSDTAVNSFANFGTNKAKQFIAVNPNGYLITDAILFGLAEREASLVGTPVGVNWVQYLAETGGYDLEVTRDEWSADVDHPRQTYRYEIMGPTTLQVLEKAHGGPIDRLKFFGMGEFTIAGMRVRALSHTMTVVPGSEMIGLELFGPAADGQAVWETIAKAGEEFGLRLGGALAYSTSTIESGWNGTPTVAIYTGDDMKHYRQWLSADSVEARASIGGSFESDNIEDYYVTPWELGYGKIIKFDHDFIGRAALEAQVDQPHRQKVWLRWNDDDVARVRASSLFGGEERAKYLETPFGTYAYSPYDCVLSGDGDRLIGLSTHNGYTVNLGSWHSLGMVDEADAQDGAEVIVVWGEENGGTAKPGVERHVQTEIRATVSTRSPRA